MRSKLDIWAVQKYKEATKEALKRIKKDSLGNILYLNCGCDLKIGDKKIKNRTFNACFYSEESDTIIFFARGKISEQEIINYLDEENIKFTIIRFIEDKEEYQDKDEFPEIWFARDEDVLIEALEDSLSKGENKCVYYPQKEADMSLTYRDKHERKHELDGRMARGVIYFKEKIILLIEQETNRTFPLKKVTNIMNKKGIVPKVVHDQKKKM